MQINDRRRNAWLAILRAGLVAGVLDITAAIVVYAHVTHAVPLLQGIASGILGRDAFTGGLPTAGLGLLCHFFIATSAAAVYYVASRRLTFLLQHAVISGAAYGIAVYFFMQLIVLPLSAIGPRPPTLADALVGVAIQIPCIGLAIALTLRRYAPASPRAHAPPTPAA
jgi:Na+/alanine symporter